MSKCPGACLVVLLAFAPLADASPELERQRAAFREAHADAELGIWELSAERHALLKDYVLWHDLRAAFLHARLGRVPDTEVRAFVERYEGLKPARELRYWRGVALAETGGAGARTLFSGLAGDRGYYGFLAADPLGGGSRRRHAAYARDGQAHDAGTGRALAGSRHAD